MLELISQFLDRSPIGHGDLPISVAVGWVALIWSHPPKLKRPIALELLSLFFYLFGNPKGGPVWRELEKAGREENWRYFSRQPNPSTLAATPDAPHVTAIRPVKGLEPHLYDCLAATFRQDYPRDKLTICLCVSTRDDPAYPLLCKIVADFPDVDARVLVEEDDPLLQDTESNAYQLGPNPKIRNMSRAYREAKGDIVWIVDCNVWIGKGVCARMVDKLCGTGATSDKKYKFVHHLPVVVDVTGEKNLAEERQTLLDASRDAAITNDGMSTSRPEGDLSSMVETGGGRMEELFLSSAHAKFYTAINTVLIAPCIVGKSNMFRRSHLDYLTGPSPTDLNPRNPGIDFFSDNICEDHLIGDLLWKKKVREEKELGESWGKHAMVFGDLAIQPVSDMRVQAYTARRVRWLRVRKFTVLLATLVEPGTESFLCSIYGAFGISTALAPYLEQKGFEFASYLSIWTCFFAIFALSIALWIMVDWTLYIRLHSAKTIELDADTPSFARPVRQGSSSVTRRPFLQWLAAWLGRELLALPIWTLAVYGGVTVVWRDRRFKVGFDAKVREIDADVRRPGDSTFKSQATVGKDNKVRRD
ncbi:hypothetical protein N7488_010140 [Penicillium malachiteum]|nr:hypothetical protein N7488_010140 [Penicillium malachiteum]